MAKKVSKWFRIGVEGDTCDGRVISGDDIQDMADTFDPRVYGCRINLEHLRGILPEALAHLQRAIQLERTIGVKKDIEQLERQLKPKPEPAPKTNKPRTRKATATPAARRGRPPKAAKAAG